MLIREAFEHAQAGMSEVAPIGAALRTAADLLVAHVVDQALAGNAVNTRAVMALTDKRGTSIYLAAQDHGALRRDTPTTSLNA